MALKLGLAVVLSGTLGLLLWLHSLLDDQRSEVERLQARIETLERKVREGGAAPAWQAPIKATANAGAQPTRAPAARIEVDEALRARLLAAPDRSGQAPSEPAREVRDALLDVLSTEDPELREGFRNLVREEQAALRDERREARQTRWEERTSERIATLAQEHGLSRSQQDALFAILTAARDAISETFREAREADAPPAREEMRAKIDAARTRADDEARELLDGEQFKAYEAMRDEGGLVGPGRRGGFGPPGEGPPADR